MSEYSKVIGEIRKGSVPWPIVVQHLKHGVKEGYSCGECSRRLAMMVQSSPTVVGYQHFCGMSYSVQTLPAETVACGKFRQKDPTGIYEVATIEAGE